MKWLVACLCLTAAPTLLAVTGRVSTSNGDIFEGEISIDFKLGLVITNAEIGTTNVPLPLFASALFNLSAEKQTNRPAAPPLNLPAGWTNQDIGRALPPGKTRSEND